MFLILDTNILFSFFRKSKVFELVRKLRKKEFKLCTPNFMYSELLNLKDEILKTSKLSNNEFDILLTILKLVVKPISKEEYIEFLPEAKEISPHLKDAPLFALSLALEKSPIWSREPKLKRQKFVRVLSDEEIVELVK